MDKSILITGTSGFIGKNLKEYLSRIYSPVLTPSSTELNLLNSGKVSDYFQKHTIDIIIHCSNRGGVRGIVDDADVEPDNRLMLDNILQFKEENAKVITFGSGAQYNKSRNLHKIKESELSASAPRDGYGKSKLYIAKTALSRNDLLCLTIFGCYGKYEKETRFPTYAIMQSINGNDIIIQNNSVFDYLYVNDLCRIIDYFIQQPPSEKVINITPTESITMVQIAQYVNTITGKQSNIIVSNKELGFEYTGDNSILLKEIPNFSFTPYSQGITELYSHINSEMLCKDQ